MGKGKDDFIEHTGGFRVGESDADFKVRAARIDELDRLLHSGKIKGKEAAQAFLEIRSLKGIPDPEWDYEPPDD